MKKSKQIQTPFLNVTIQKNLLKLYFLAIAIVATMQEVKCQTCCCPPPNTGYVISDYAIASVDAVSHPKIKDTVVLNSYTWAATGMTYTTSGVYTHPRITLSGCTIVDTLKLQLIHFSFTYQPISCYGNNDGVIEIAIDQPVAFQCTLDGGTPANDIGGIIDFSGLTPGIHVVCVIGWSTCETHTFSDPDPLQVNIITISPVSCMGNDGQLNATITGGTHIIQPYTTYWTNSMNVNLNPFNNFATNISGLSTGMYYLSVEDDNGCFANASTMLGNTPPVVVTASSTGANCSNGLGAITITSTGGTGAKTYTVNGMPLMSTYPPGTYNVMATDTKGCTGTTIVTVSPAQVPFITISSNASTLCTGSSATLSASGATTYAWTPASGLNTTTGSTVIATPSLATTYIVTGTNASGCSATALTSINVIPSAVLYSINVSPSTVPCGGSTILTANSNLNYCGAGATNIGCSTGREYISFVSFGSINNTSACAASGQYQNFSSIVTSVVAGNAYPITIVNGHHFAGDQVRVWVDWNHNGLFTDANETYTLTYSQVTTGTIAVPFNAVNGPARMRIRLNFTGTMSPCGTTSFGEVEDYTLNVSGGIPSTVTYSWSQSGASILSGSMTNVESATNITGNTIFTVMATPLNGCTSSAQNSVTVSGTCNSVLNLTCLIEGYWNEMNGLVSVLANEGQPTTPTACDSINVELHTQNSPYNMVASTRTILNQNGMANCVFPSLSGSYYIAVKHRNALLTWSSIPIVIGTVPAFYDFSLSASQAYGANQIQVAPGKWAFYSGDLNSDENIDLLDATLLENDINTFSFGYFNTDINGDGNVDLLDSPALEANINNFIFSNHP